MTKQIKVEWCENFIRAMFNKLPAFATGIEVNLFWDRAVKSGLYEKGTYGTPMSEALSTLCEVETVSTETGEFCYNSFKLKKA